MGLSIWGRGAMEIAVFFLGLAVGMTAAWMAGLINPSNRQSSRDRLDRAAAPAFSDYGFDIGLLPAFLAAGARAFRAVGVLTTCHSIMPPGDIRTCSISAKVCWPTASANVAGGLLGTAGMSIRPSMVGISTATGDSSRGIAFVAAGYLLILGISPKLAGSFLLIRPEVAGSIMVFTARFLITSGMQLILSGRRFPGNLRNRHRHPSRAERTRFP